MEAQSSFGEWLRARRKALDLTQFELAERAGCAEDTIGRIEAGTRRPSRQVAALLAEALGVPAQSQADFVRFAREGGSAAGLGRIEITRDTPDTAAPTVSPANVAAPAQPSRAHPGAWVPYLSSLPNPPTLLIGRDDELAAAGGLLRSGQARLLTLTGPPGVGKTRMALAVASSLVPSFPDGICFVPLAPLRDPDSLGLTVAHALGLSDNTEGGGTQAAQAGRLVEFIRHKRLLLVLDNFEHILGATHRLGEWLSASAHLQMLVTSRSALHLRGERLFPVSTLPVPPARAATVTRAGERTTIPNSEFRIPNSMDAVEAQVAAYPSVGLFVERAQAVDPDFRLTETNWRAVGELCRRMEGLPLAIELTAARSARLAPEIVLARLEKRLDVVRSGPRDLPHHQRTLRAAIEWSYDLLDEPARLLFDRMSAFTGGATLDALEAVCNAHEDVEGGLDEALESLLQQSLVYRVTIQGEDDIQISSRFNMLEMLREYAAEQLAEREKAWAVDSTGEGLPRTTYYALRTASVRRYHAEYYLAMAQAAELQKRADEQQSWLDRLERDHDNLRAAIQWAIDSGQIDMAAGLCAALWNFWKVRGYLSEGRSWLDKVLAYEGAPSPEGDPLHISPLTLAKALNGAGVLARAQADYGIGASLHERSLAIFRELDDKQGIANSLNNLGVDFHYMDQVDRAEELYQASLEAMRELGDLEGMSRPLHNLGLIAQSREDDTLAIHYFRESLEIERAGNNKGGVAISLYNLGTQLTPITPGAASAEAWEEAEKCFTESLALARDLGNKSLLALCLTKLGELALEKGDETNLAEATDLFADSLEMQKELGDREAIAYTLNDLGHAELFRGDRAAARSVFEESLRLSRTLETPGKVILNLGALAVTMGADALASHSQEEAHRCAKRAVQLYAASAASREPILMPAKRHYYNATMDAVHAMLPDDEREALEALGQRMSLDEAIGLALDGCG